MHYGRHCTVKRCWWPTWLRSRTRQPMTIGLALLTHWSVCQFSSVTSLCISCVFQDFFQDASVAASLQVLSTSGKWVPLG